MRLPAILLALVAAPGPAWALDTSPLLNSPDPPPPLEIQNAFPGLKFDQPLQLTHAGDGTDRIFVCTRPGLIHVFPNRADVQPADTRLFLDLSGLVATRGQEEGLMSVAFHPRYRDNGVFFVYYTERPLASVIARYRVSTADPDRADPQSAERILTFPQPFANHNGGSMQFGPDGFLYVGLGDGGSGGDPFGHGQNLGTLLGSILRIDVDRRQGDRLYAVPPDNPFVNRPDARGEIWAYGLRNVWRLAFDRTTGELWAADVGQDNWEEVNIIRRGGNYGWDYREGRHPFSTEPVPQGLNLIEPVWEYHHSLGKSITGGFVYRGRRLPEIAGAYLFADYVSGHVWALWHESGRVTRHVELTPPTALPITSFGEDQAGEAYFTAFDGRVYRFRRPAKVAAPATPFPHKLSQTGLFRSLADMQPAAGMIPYDVNVPLWSDDAAKQRFIALPRGAKVRFDPSDQWEFPVGSVLVKTFLLGTHRLETRLFVHAPQGWRGFTYLWNDAQDDADLLDGALLRKFPVRTSSGVVQQPWYFPSRSDCLACHTPAAGHVLGLNTRQLNRPDPDGVNQLERLARLGLFADPLPAPADQLEANPDWTADDASTDALARAYLDVNCAVCHRPGGSTGTPLDLRQSTPLSHANLLGRPPTRGRLAEGRSAIVTPGVPAQSELYLRMNTRGRRQMPNLATAVVDSQAVEVIAKWIELMDNDRAGRARKPGR